MTRLEYVYNHANEITVIQTWAYTINTDQQIIDVEMKSIQIIFIKWKL